MALVLISCTSTTQDDAKTILKNNSINNTAIDTSILCWTDFIIGEYPMVGVFVGMDSLTKKYGICYNRILNGCEMTNEADSLRNDYHKKNELYFKQLELKLGADWKKRFDTELILLNRAIAKKYATKKL
jgi:hypothetical protein